MMSSSVPLISSLLLLYAIPSISQSNECIFIDTTTNEYKLDLSSLINTELFYYDGSTYNYTYTVCSNSLDCEPENAPSAIVSLKQGEPYDIEHDQDCWWLAQWDNGKVQPTYNSTTQVWSFMYQGMSCHDGPIRNTTINWHCNSSIEHKIISVNETTPCNYQVQVLYLY